MPMTYAALVKLIRDELELIEILNGNHEPSPAIEDKAECIASRIIEKAPQVLKR